RNPNLRLQSALANSLDGIHRDSFSLKLFHGKSHGEESKNPGPNSYLPQGEVILTVKESHGEEIKGPTLTFYCFLLCRFGIGSLPSKPGTAFSCLQQEIRVLSRDSWVSSRLALMIHQAVTR